MAAAHRLAELSRERGLGLSITLLEQAGRLGGLLETRAQDGFVMEGGADAFLTDSPWAMELCRRVGLAEELVETNSASRRSFILRGERLVPVPEGFYLVAPARAGACWRAPGLNWIGKARMALEPLIPPRQDDADESAADFIRRRFGRQALERIGKPMVGGIYTADLARLSARAALPRLVEMERGYGSVARGLRLSRNGAGSAAAGAEKASGPRYGLFMTLRGGMSRLIDALAARMPEVSVRTGAGVARVERWGAGWAVALEGGETLEADAILLAVPADRAAELLRAAAPELAGELSAVEYESAVIVNLAYREADLPRPLAGFGFVSDDARSPVVGCTFSSVKFPGRAPAGRALLRCFLGGALHPGVEEWDDRLLASAAMDAVRKAAGITAQPALTWVRRHRRAMPQYHVGHLERIQTIERLARAQPGLYLAGNGYRGIGIPDCIHQAEQAAELLADELGERAPA